MSTASTPPTHDVGPVQLRHTSPPSIGTRPLATAPAIMPRKNGVITDDAANIAPYTRGLAERGGELAEREARAPQDDAQGHQHPRDRTAW